MGLIKQTLKKKIAIYIIVLLFVPVSRQYLHFDRLLSFEKLRVTRSVQRVIVIGYFV